MRHVGPVGAAVLLLSLAACGAAPPPAAPSPANAARPAQAAAPGQAGTVAGAPPRIVRRFVGVPMPPNNVLDLDRTVVVGGDSDWLGRIFFAAPMTVDQTIEFYRRDMPRYGWTELAVTRSETSVLAYRMGDRLATIELTPVPNAAVTRVEFWVNPIRDRSSQQAAQPAAPAPPLMQSTSTPPSSLPWGPIDGGQAPPPRAVDQAPLPPVGSR